MLRFRSSVTLLALVACQPTSLSQTCPSPVPGASSTLVTQLLLRRARDLGPGAPDFSISLTASGDALYSGSPSVPVPGQYLGRLGAERFNQLVAQLRADGLVPADPASSVVPPNPGCGAESVISLSLQTADGRFAQLSFCPSSAEESRLARPIYRAVESIRWQPGGRVLGLASTD